MPDNRPLTLGQLNALVGDRNEPTDIDAVLCYADAEGKPFAICGGIFTVSERHGNTLLLAPIKLNAIGGF